MGSEAGLGSVACEAYADDENAATGRSGRLFTTRTEQHASSLRTVAMIPLRSMGPITGLADVKKTQAVMQRFSDVMWIHSEKSHQSSDWGGEGRGLMQGRHLGPLATNPSAERN